MKMELYREYEDRKRSLHHEKSKLYGKELLRQIEEKKNQRAQIRSEESTPNSPSDDSNSKHVVRRRENRCLSPNSYGSELKRQMIEDQQRKERLKEQDRNLARRTCDTKTIMDMTGSSTLLPSSENARVRGKVAVSPSKIKLSIDAYRAILDEQMTEKRFKENMGQERHPLKEKNSSRAQQPFIPPCDKYTHANFGEAKSSPGCESTDISSHGLRCERAVITPSSRRSNISMIEKTTAQSNDIDRTSPQRDDGADEVYASLLKMKMAQLGMR